MNTTAAAANRTTTNRGVKKAADVKEAASPTPVGGEATGVGSGEAAPVNIAFGVGSSECFCGNYFKDEGEVDGDGCDYPCAGKPSAACGGRGRMNVYEFDHTYYAEDEEGVVTPEPDNMLGCFKDTKYNRILNLETNYKSDDMTPEKCYRHCKGVAGAMYYGVEFGTECFCGGQESKYHDYPLEESSCMMPCPGDLKTFCGGRNAMNVYGSYTRH